MNDLAIGFTLEALMLKKTAGLCGKLWLITKEEFLSAAKEFSVVNAEHEFSRLEKDNLIFRQGKSDFYLAGGIY
jgi:hypothetical protein